MAKPKRVCSALTRTRKPGDAPFQWNCPIPSTRPGTLTNDTTAVGLAYHGYRRCLDVRDELPSHTGPAFRQPAPLAVTKSSEPDPVLGFPHHYRAVLRHRPQARKHEMTTAEEPSAAPKGALPPSGFDWWRTADPAVVGTGLPPRAGQQEGRPSLRSGEACCGGLR